MYAEFLLSWVAGLLSILLAILVHQITFYIIGHRANILYGTVLAAAFIFGHYWYSIPAYLVGHIFSVMFSKRYFPKYDPRPVCTKHGNQP